jgi:hypothetical protein
MAPPNLVAHALAEALLAEPASPRQLAAWWSGVLGLDRTPAWLRRMARRVTGRVASSGRRDARQLVELIARDVGFALAARGGALAVRRWPVVEAAMQPAPGPPSTWEIPELATSGDLAAWLGLSTAELDWFAGTEARPGRTAPGPLAHYRCTWRAKRGGGLRLIEAPKDRLRAIQRRILHAILDHVPPHDAADAFRKGRSILTHAAHHAGSEVVIVLDLASFFLSVRASRVFALFRTLGYPEPVSRLLTGLTTCATSAEVWAGLPPPRFAAEVTERFRARRLHRAAHLPQGAPTSPSLANLATFRLDVRLAAAASACGARYSRYADDLTFSGGADLARRADAFHTMVSAIVLEEGFTVNERKTRVLRRSVRQVVTGLVVNTRPNVRRDELKRLEAILYNCLRDGPAVHNRDGHEDFRAHVAGRVAWVASVNAPRGAKLQTMLDRIDWAR